MSFAGCFLHISAVRSQLGPSGSQGQDMVRLVVEGDAVDLAHEIQYHHAIVVIQGTSGKWETSRSSPRRP